MTSTHLEAIAGLIEHLRAGTTDAAPADLRVPAEHFVSTERLADELAVLRRVPLIVAHESELANPGAFITRDVLGTSLLLVRDDASINAFRNMCRHRGGRVEPDASGSKRLFTCRYHGWSYERDGQLRHVPYEDDFDPIDRACHALLAVHCELRHGFVWVDFSDPSDGAVDAYLGPEVVEQLESFDFDGSVVFLDETLELDINWKLVLDGTIDMLHARFLHPDTVGKYFHTNKAVWRDYGLHGQVFTARRRLERLEHAEDAADNPWDYMATNLVVFPNSTVIAAPDHVELWTVWPSIDDPGKCTINFRFLVRDELLDGEMRERMTRSWEILRDAGVLEDFPMEASIQANARSAPGMEFLYGRCEVPCQHLHVQLQCEIERNVAVAKEHTDARV